MLAPKYIPRIVFVCSLLTLLLLAACDTLSAIQIPNPEIVRLTPLPPEAIATDTALAEDVADNGSEDNASTNSTDTAAASEPETPNSGRLAVVTPIGELITVNFDGSDERQLSSEGRFQFPAWSPTENTVAAISISDEESGIFVFADNGASSGERIFSPDLGSPLYLYWKPDGSGISFITPDEEGGLSLSVVPADGTGERSVLATGQPMFWKWLPSSKQAIIHANGERLSFVDGINAESQTGLGRQGQYQAPAISNNLRLLSYQTLGEDGRSLTIKDLREDSVVFEEPHNGILTMSWSPTQSQLAFTNPTRAGSFFGPLHLFEDGRSYVLVPDQVVSFFWSPDGNQIAFLTTAENNQQADSSKTIRFRTQAQQQRPFLTVGVVDIRTGQQRLLHQFTPNGLYISQFVPFFDQYALSHRIWSPDSQYVVMPSINDDNDRKIIVIPVDGSPVIEAADGIAAFWSYR